MVILAIRVMVLEGSMLELLELLCRIAVFVRVFWVNRVVRLVRVIYSLV